MGCSINVTIKKNLVLYYFVLELAKKVLEDQAMSNG